MEASWTSETDEKNNFTKLCRLLYDGGTLALKSVFDGIVPPASLGTALSRNKAKLQNLKRPTGKVLSNDQWDLLYPPSGIIPKSENFDITLLSVLLRNICGLAPPATGWDKLPLPTDASQVANLVRIKYYRNTVIAHKSKSEVDATLFHMYWRDISDALVALGLKQGDIDDLKSSLLRGKDYNKLVNDWYLSDQQIKDQLEALKSNTSELKQDTNQIKSDIEDIKECVASTGNHTRNLSIHAFDCKIEKLCKTYHPNTRKWLMTKIKSAVKSDRDQASAMVIEAGPGMGKSVVAGKLCQEYKQQGILGGCHFFKHDNSLLNNPRLMLQSVAKQLCNVCPEYSSILNERLSNLDVSNLNCEELFTLLFQECCHNLKPDGYFVIIIDALDECCNTYKRELFKTLKQISSLPSWLRFVLTTRPPPDISSLRLSQTFTIDPKGSNNERDLHIFFNDKLQELKYLSHQTDGYIQLIIITEGLFLVAYFVIDLLRRRTVSSISEAVEQLPKGITSVYEDYFSRLQNSLKPYIQSEDGFFDMLEAIVAAKYPVPKIMFYSILGLKDEPRVPKTEREEAVNLLHQLFPVENDHVSPFHKTVIDWLTTDGHEFRVKGGGCDILADQYYDALNNMKERLKENTRLQTPHSLTDDDCEALQHALIYIKGSKHFQTVQTDPGLLCLYAIFEGSRRKQLKINYWEWNIENVHSSETDQSGFNIENYFSKDSRLVYDGLLRHFLDVECVPVVSVCIHPSLKQLLEFSYRAACLLKMGNTEKTLEYLKENAVPYIECEEILDINGIEHIRQMVCYNSGFLLVRHMKKTTMVGQYHLGGILVKETSFDGHRELYMSPDDESVVSIPLSGKRDIEIIDTDSLIVKNSYPCPHMVKSCHVFGQYPWHIILRCHNNMMYVMEGQTGQLVEEPTPVHQDDVVLDVSKKGHLLLKKRSALSNFNSNLYSSSAFEDERQCLIVYEPYKADFQELFITDCTNLNGTIPIYIRTCQPCCTSNSQQHRDRSSFALLFCFSHDAELLAVSYGGYISIVHTRDGSLYKTVFLEPHELLFLSKERLVIHGYHDIYFLKFGAKKEEVIVEHIFYLPIGAITDKMMALKDDQLRPLVVLETSPNDAAKKPIICKYEFVNSSQKPLK